MEEVVQQLVVRAGDDVHVLVAHQEAGAAAGLQGQRAGELQDVRCCAGTQQSGEGRNGPMINHPDKFTTQQLHLSQQMHVLRANVCNPNVCTAVIFSMT